MAPKKKERKGVEMAAIQDKNESIKKCVICLDVVTVRGKIPVCDHQFCYTCIHEWSKTTNTCPLCKKRFRCISKISESSPPRPIRISDKDQTEHYHEEDDFNAFSFSDDSEHDEPNDSLADFIVNDSSFDEADESITSSFTSPPTIRRGWQWRLNPRITSTINTRARRNQVHDLPSTGVFFSPPVTRNRSRGTQLLLDFETVSSSSPLPSSSQEQDSISPIATRGRPRTNNRVLSSNESSLATSPNITESESNNVDSSSDSSTSIVSSSPDSPSRSHLNIISSTSGATNSDNTDSDVPLRNPSLSLRRNPAIRLPLRRLRPLRPVIERIKLRESDNGARSTELSSGVVFLVSKETSTPSSSCSSPHSSVNVIEESPVETEREREEEEEEEEEESDEDATQPLSSPNSSQEVNTHHYTNKRRSAYSPLPLCPLSSNVSLSPTNLQPLIIKRRAKSRIINDSTSEDESIEEVPNRKRTRRQVKSSPPKWLSSRRQRGAISSNMRRTRGRGNRRRMQASDSGSDYNPFDF